MEKEQIRKNNVEKVNKERRVILIGILSLFGFIKIISALGGEKKRSKGIGTFFIANALLKIGTLIRFILKI